MTTPQVPIPAFLTRADVVGQVAGAAAGAASPAGGLGMVDLEAVFAFVQRFQGGMEKFTEMIGQLRGFEQADQGATPDAGGVRVGQGSTITGEKVYSVMLKSLKEVAEIFPDLTMAEALIEARERKEEIIPSIDAELIKMATPDPSPAE